MGKVVPFYETDEFLLENLYIIFAMEEFSEELYLFDNTIQLFLVQILYRQKIHAFHITRQAELLKSCVDDL